MDTLNQIQVNKNKNGEFLFNQKGIHRYNLTTTFLYTQIKIALRSYLK